MKHAFETHWPSNSIATSSAGFLVLFPNEPYPVTRTVLEMEAMRAVAVACGTASRVIPCPTPILIPTVVITHMQTHATSSRRCVRGKGGRSRSPTERSSQREGSINITSIIMIFCRHLHSEDSTQGTLHRTTSVYSIVPRESKRYSCTRVIFQNVTDLCDGPNSQTHTRNTQSHGQTPTHRARQAHAPTRPQPASDPRSLPDPTDPPSEQASMCM
jgi:hypothetical protein